MDWPALSPDLNIIELVWGWVVREVYKNNRQYANKNELWDAILRAMDSVPRIIN